MSGDFTDNTKRILAKCAGEKCSLCGIGTSKPKSDEQDFINLGEAAHIRGNKEGNHNRYDKNMTDEERKDISNGIWLCRTCHKKIDSDDKKYTPDYLMKAKKEHQERISSGYFDVKFPDYEHQQIINHDQSVFNLSTEKLNEIQLRTFLELLQKQKFIYLDNKELKQINDYLEFHNLSSNLYLTTELNSAYSDFRDSINRVLLELYDVDDNNKSYAVDLNSPFLIFIGMQPPRLDNSLMIPNYKSYNAYKYKFEMYSRKIDFLINDVLTRYNNYRDKIKKMIYT